MALKAGYKGIKKCGPGLKYDNVNGILSLEGESSLKLDNLEDVAITTPLQGDVLIYDGEDWVNEQPDTDPTEDSANLVTSGGVYDALQARVDWLSYAKTGVHNVLPNNLKTETASGITLTVNADKSLTLSNAATGDKTFDIGTLPKECNGFKINGLTGGSSSTYEYFIRFQNSALGYLGEQVVHNGDVVINCPSAQLASLDSIAIKLRIKNGTSFATPVTVYPMVRHPEDVNTAYAPYAMTNRELTELATLQESACTDIIEGATVSTGQGGNHLVKRGNVVSMLLCLESVTASSFGVLAKIPSGYRPNYTVITTSARNVQKSIYISAEGNISCSEALSGVNINISATWVA